VSAEIPWGSKEEFERAQKVLIEGLSIDVWEWRVSGQPNPLPNGDEFPPYVHVWYSTQVYDEKGRQEGILEFSAREAAIGFASRMTGWTDGPHLHCRKVTYSPWVEIPDA
jgi:hypothetical protein